MDGFLRHGFAEVAGGLGAALKFFWPVFLVYLAMGVLGLGLGYFWIGQDVPDFLFFLIYFVIIFAAIISTFLVLCQGAVAWHRRIVLNEPARWISPVPRLRSLKYAWAVFLFALIFLAGYLGLSFFLLPVLDATFTSPLGQIDLSKAPVEQLEAWRRAVWPIQIITLALTILLAAAVLWFGRSWLLIFPYISVRSTEPAFRAVRESLNYPTGLVGALLIVYFLPSLLGLIHYLVVPMSVQMQPAFIAVTTILMVVVYAFCFLWGLSILSLAFRRAAAGTMPVAQPS